MAKKLFRVTEFEPDYSKWIEIEGPNLSLRIDYDDVEHEAVELATKKMLKILNANWETTPDA